MSESTPVLDALNEAVESARHLSALDAPTVEAARALARKIDAQDVYFEALMSRANETNGRPPSVDNVSLPTFLRYCEALGLAPGARSRAGIEAEVKQARKVGKLRAVAGGKAG